MSGRVVKHSFPNAQVIFVKKFQADRQSADIDDVVAVASNIGDVAEILSINIDMTVKNNPGTFNLTLSNSKNKFFRADKPDTEIKLLKQNSNRNKKGGRTIISSNPNLTPNPEVRKKIELDSAVETGVGNFYPFSDLNSFNNFKYIILYPQPGAEDQGEFYPTFFSTENSTGNIVERWAVNRAGNIIFVCSSNEEEKKLQQLLTDNHGTISKEFEVSGSEKPVKFIVKAFKNSLFTTSLKDISEQGDNPGEFQRGRCIIEPMQRVAIFLSESQNNLNTKPKLIRAFTGVVSAVQEGYSENKATISVKGEDVTKYLQLSVVNVNPALKIREDLPPDQNPEENITVWSNIFRGKSIPDIVKALLLGNPTAGESQLRDGVLAYQLASNTEYTVIEYDPDTDSYLKTKDIRKGKKEYAVVSFKKMLGHLFTKSGVHIYDFFTSGVKKLKGCSAYRLAFNGNISFFQADFKTRREIIYKCAEDSHFVFYADRFGEMWFMPPRYSNSHILGALNPDIYIIKNEDIISYGFIEDDSQIYSSTYVTTEPPLGTQEATPAGYFAGAYRDDNVVLKYGIRIFVANNPLIRSSQYENDIIPSLAELSANVTAYAKSLHQRLLAGRYQGQITIPGRVELEINRPVYIPIRNRIYYVESLTHNFTFGGSFTTTLSLSYGRKPWEYLPELITFSTADDMYLCDGYVFEDIPSLNIATGVTASSSESTYQYDYELKAPSSGDISRLERYKTYIEDAAKEYQIEIAAIKATIVKESNVDPNAVSKKGAKGLMQLMPGTFRDMTVGGDITDPRSNIFAGTKYLRRLFNYYQTTKQFKTNWKVFGVAAYNAGIGHITIDPTTERIIQMPDETKKYLPIWFGYYKYFLNNS